MLLLLTGHCVSRLASQHLPSSTSKQKKRKRFPGVGCPIAFSLSAQLSVWQDRSGRCFSLLRFSGMGSIIYEAMYGIKCWGFRVSVSGVFYCANLNPHLHFDRRLEWKNRSGHPSLSLCLVIVVSLFKGAVLRTACRPTFRAAAMTRSTSCGVRYSRVRRLALVGLRSPRIMRRNWSSIVAIASSPTSQYRTLNDGLSSTFGRNL